MCGMNMMDIPEYNLTSYHARWIRPRLQTRWQILGSVYILPFFDWLSQEEVVNYHFRPKKVPVFWGRIVVRGKAGFSASFRYYYDKKQIAKSVEAFKLALDINPMYKGIWFTLGWAADLNTSRKQQTWTSGTG